MLKELIPNKVYYKIFHRQNTKSTGRYNINRPGADLTEIEKNIAIIKSDLNCQNIKFLSQVHGNEVINSTINNCNLREEADGHITKDTELALAICTADCVPVLLASNDGDYISALHCGWRSAKSGIIAKAVKMIKNHSDQDIKAIIGPSIMQKSYEVDNQYYQDFIQDDGSITKLFKPSSNAGHYLFDLPGYVELQLHKENIEVIDHIQEDTYSMEDKYPSYRRTQHNKQPYNKNILSIIVKKI